MQLLYDCVNNLKRVLVKTKLSNHYIVINNIKKLRIVFLIYFLSKFLSY